MKKTKKIISQCGQKNSFESVDVDFQNTTGKSFGDPNPITTAVSSGLIVPSHDTKLLKRVVQYLADASVILRANNNQFLADAATELAIQIKNSFGISQ